MGGVPRDGGAEAAARYRQYEYKAVRDRSGVVSLYRWMRLCVMNLFLFLFSRARARDVRIGLDWIGCGAVRSRAVRGW